jgi:hypothetical protein
LRLHKKGWGDNLVGCNVSKVSVGGKEDSRPVYEIVANCVGEGNTTWDEALRVYVDKKGLLHLRTRVTNEREEG